MSKEKKTDYGAQSPKYLNDESVDDILANVDQFIEGVYRDLSITPPHSAAARNSIRFQTRRSPIDSSPTNDSPVEATSVSLLSSGDDSRNPISPSTRLNMDAEIERINRMCDSVNKNLRSIGVIMNNSGECSSSEERLNINTPSSPISTFSSTNIITDLSLDVSPPSTTESANSETRRLRSYVPIVADIPLQTIDLSVTQTQNPLPLDNINHNNDDDDDDVIIVSANINPVVDLCTPGEQQETSRRRRLIIDHSDLNRRRLSIPDLEIVDNFNASAPTPARRRRTENKQSSLDISVIEVGNNKTKNNNSSTGAESPDRTPYMCSVCMDSCLHRQPTSTRCGHIFCNQCIQQAIQITRKCPLCNTKISKNHIFRIYP